MMMQHMSLTQRLCKMNELYLLGLKHMLVPMAHHISSWLLA